LIACAGLPLRRQAARPDCPKPERDPCPVAVTGGTPALALSLLASRLSAPPHFTSRARSAPSPPPDFLPGGRRAGFTPVAFESPPVYSLFQRHHRGAQVHRPWHCGTTVAASQGTGACIPTYTRRIGCFISPPAAADDWNWLVSGLPSAPPWCCSTARPFILRAERLLDMIDASTSTSPATSASTCRVAKKAGARPAQSHGLSGLKSLACATVFAPFRTTSC